MKMKVIAYDPYLSDERAIDLGVEKVELEELLRRADFITLHTPLTDKTRNIINADSLKLTKKSLRLINCARGGLVDEAALVRRARIRPIAGAALDVFATSRRRESPLFNCPTSSAPRISALRPPKRRKTSRCRSPSRCRII